MATLAFWVPSTAAMFGLANAVIGLTFITLAALLLAHLAKHDPVLRYWILCTGLMLGLACPAAAVVMQRAGIGLVFVNAATADVASARAPVALATTDSDSPPHPRPLSLAESEKRAISPVAVVAPRVDSPPHHDGQRGERAGVAVVVPPVATAAVAVARPRNVVPTSVAAALALWAMVAAALVARMLRSWFAVRRIVRRATPAVGESWDRLATECSRFMKLRRAPPIAISSALSSPVVVGVWRPRLILPAGILERISQSQLREILIHEMAHVARRDVLMVWLQNLAGAVVWPHPLIHLLNRELARAREEICDNFVLAVSDAPQFSCTLLHIAELISPRSVPPMSVAMFTSNWRLETRVAGLLHASRQRNTRLTSRGKVFIATAFLALAALTVLASAALAQSDSQPHEAKTYPVRTPNNPFATEAAEPDATHTVAPSAKPVAVPATATKPVVHIRSDAEVNQLIAGDWFFVAAAAELHSLNKKEAAIRALPDGPTRTKALADISQSIARLEQSIPEYRKVTVRIVRFREQAEAALAEEFQGHLGIDAEVRAIEKEPAAENDRAVFAIQSKVDSDKKLLAQLRSYSNDPDHDPVLESLRKSIADKESSITEYCKAIKRQNELCASVPDPLMQAAAGNASAVAEAPKTASKPIVELPPSLEVPVLVAHPIQREVTDEEVGYNGRIEATQNIQIMPRVTGYLVHTVAKEGATVQGPTKDKPGEVLFEIDPRPYQAEFNAAKAEFVAAEARLREAQAHSERAAELNKTPGAITPEDLQLAETAVETANAATAAAKLQLETCQANLDACTVRAPIGGRLGRFFLTDGNLVTKDKTGLTTIVASGPLQVSFDLDERAYLRIRRAVNSGELKNPEGGDLQISFRLVDETGYPHHAVVNYIAQEANPTTGTVHARAIMTDSPQQLDRLMLPGMHADVIMQIGGPHMAIVVNDRAIEHSSDAMLDLFVVGSDGKLEVRPVVGGAFKGHLREVVSGLKLSDQVVVAPWTGMQHWPPLGVKLKFKEVPMPTGDRQ